MYGEYVGYIHPSKPGIQSVPVLAVSMYILLERIHVNNYTSAVDIRHYTVQINKMGLLKLLKI